VTAALLLRAAAAAALLAAGSASASVGAPGAPAGAVTFLAGEATRAAGGKSEKLAVGGLVREGDVVETRRRTRLELRLADGSVLRLGPLSRATLERARFGASPDERKVSAKLLVGQVWANVAKAVGGEARFEVRTDNAVAGVRGTTFRVDAAKDRSVVVRVYSGSVAVATGPVPRPAHAGTQERRPIAGPEEVSKAEWERLVTSMMLVRVGGDGVPAEPVAFALAPADPWETWNRERDAR
jgi:hypothetical protein